MVKEVRHKMEEWNWRVLGHDPERYKAGKLPQRRLDFPLPESISGIHILERMFLRMHNDLRECHAHTKDMPSVIMGVDFLFKRYQQELRDMQQEWEGELKEQLKTEHTAKVVGIGQAG